MLKGLDLDDFWEDSKDARKQYVEGPITPALLREVEKELGFRLPRSYVELMRSQNGGFPKRTCFRTKVPTSWAKDHIAITAFCGIGRKKERSLLGPYGNPFMREEVGYPSFGILICDCPSAGHDMVMLDYRKCGPTGEPAVIHVDQELDNKITKLAPNFEAFVRGLVDDSAFEDESEDDVPSAAELAAKWEAELRIIRSGPFSKALTRLLASSRAPRKNEKTLRRLFDTIATTKDLFFLFSDPIDYLVYDFLFSLFAATRTVRTLEEFRDAYKGLLMDGKDGQVKQQGNTWPYALDEWIKARRAGGMVVERDGKLTLSAAHQAAMEKQLAAYR